MRPKAAKMAHHCLYPVSSKLPKFSAFALAYSIVKNILLTLDGLFSNHPYLRGPWSL